MFQICPALFPQAASERHPTYFSRWFANHFRELAIRIQHGAVARKSGRAFAHGLYQHPIGGLSAFQFYQLLAMPAQNHQSIHFAGLDGGQSFLRCFQPGAKFLPDPLVSTVRFSCEAGASAWS